MAVADARAAGTGTASAASQLDSSAGSLQSYAGNTQSRLPPPCASGVRAAYSAMLSSAAKAAVRCENAVAALNAGKTGTADSGLAAVQRDLSAAATDGDRAVSAAQPFGGTG